MLSTLVILSLITTLTIATFVWGVVVHLRGQRELSEIDDFVSTLDGKLQTFRPQRTRGKQATINLSQSEFSDKQWSALEHCFLSQPESHRKALYIVPHRGRFPICQQPLSITPPGRWGIAAPTLATMLGIWGTFWGVNIGLAQSNLASSQGTQQLFKNSQQLFHGMETAFLTSLWGMGSAILMILFVAWVRHRFRQRQTKVRQLLKEVCLVLTPTSYLPRLFQQVDHLQRQVQQLSQHELSENLQLAVSEVMVQFDDMLERRLSPESSQTSTDSSIQALRNFIKDENKDLQS